MMYILYRLCYTDISLLRFHEHKHTVFSAAMLDSSKDRPHIAKLHPNISDYVNGNVIQVI